MNPKSLQSRIGIGATDELSLRVSVGALVRVLFEHPIDGEWMLALERKATFWSRQDEHSVDVKAQPFGGALRIHDRMPLQNLIGDFHFDSEESRSEQDFRLFIRPTAWEILREFCSQQLRYEKDAVLESDPLRELTEEFAGTLKVNLQPDQFTYQAVGIVVEDHPSATEYFHARGYPTARIYRIFEARILDLSLASALTRNSEDCSDDDLRDLALQDSQKGGSGRANAVLTLPLRAINDFYLTIPPEARNRPIWFQDQQLDETVTAILEGVTVPKYQRLPS